MFACLFGVFVLCFLFLRLKGGQSHKGRLPHHVLISLSGCSAL